MLLGAPSPDHIASPTVLFELVSHLVVQSGGVCRPCRVLHITGCVLPSPSRAWEVLLVLHLVVPILSFFPLQGVSSYNEIPVRRVFFFAQLFSTCVCGLCRCDTGARPCMTSRFRRQSKHSSPRGHAAPFPHRFALSSAGAEAPTVTHLRPPLHCHWKLQTSQRQQYRESP